MIASWMRVSVLTALAASIGCHAQRTTKDFRTGQVDITQIRAAERDSFAKLPRCVLPPLGDTTGWIRFAGSVLAVPSEFRPDTSPPFYIHGGQRWIAGKWEYAVASGFWGWTSFSGGTKCLLKLDGRDAMYSVSKRKGRQSEIVWLPDSAHITIGSEIFVTEGPAADRALLARLLQTHPTFDP
jgi:hypothetical protein